MSERSTRPFRFGLGFISEPFMRHQPSAIDYLSDGKEEEGYCRENGTIKIVFRVKRGLGRETFLLCFGMKFD